VVTGISGSGKSSLAFDTIYAEGQRRYIESLSAFARQFLEQMEKPDVDSVEGLSPAISIEQKTTSRSPRSTVGTVTEIYDYMRLLFASVGEPHCHICGKRIAHQTLDQIVDSILTYPADTRVLILAPVVRDRKGEFKKLFEKYLKKGFVRIRIDGQIYELEEDIRLSRTRAHTVEVIVDRVIIRPGIRRRLEMSVKSAMELGEGLVTVAVVDKEEKLYSERQACIDCGVNIPDLEPRSFSFNSKYGACPGCEGVGTQMVFNPEKLVLDPSRPISRLEFPVESHRIQSYLSESLISVAKKFSRSGNTSFEGLPAKAKELYFNGSSEPIELSVGSYRYTAEFKGIRRWLEELYRESDNPKIREDLEKLFSVQSCPTCGGSRLRPESRAVRLDGKSISEFARLPLDDCLREFRNLSFGPREEKIAGQILREICDRLEFLKSFRPSTMSD
jgi:excinuclease ABC subunit A